MGERDDDDDSELDRRRYGPQIHRNGNELNKLIWVICGVLAAGVLAMQMWTMQRLVDNQIDVAQRLTRIEERLGISR